MEVAPLDSLERGLEDVARVAFVFVKKCSFTAWAGSALHWRIHVDQLPIRLQQPEPATRQACTPSSAASRRPRTSSFMTRARGVAQHHRQLEDTLERHAWIAKSTCHMM